MIHITDFWHLNHTDVVVHCVNGDSFVGFWSDYTSEADNEPDPASIIVDEAGGGLRELYVQEIKTIVPAKAS